MLRRFEVAKRYAPTLLPQAINPMPFALTAGVGKHAAAAATLGVKQIPAPRPTHIPWQTNSCQYLVETLNIIKPKTCSRLPPSSSAA